MKVAMRCFLTTLLCCLFFVAVLANIQQEYDELSQLTPVSTFEMKPLSLLESSSHAYMHSSSEQSTETETESTTETSTETEATAETEATTETEASTETEAATEAEAEATTETATEAEAETESTAEVEATTETEAEAETETESEQEAKPKAAKAGKPAKAGKAAKPAKPAGKAAAAKPAAKATPAKATKPAPAAAKAPKVTKSATPAPSAPASSVPRMQLDESGLTPLHKLHATHSALRSLHSLNPKSAEQKKKLDAFDKFLQGKGKDAQRLKSKSSEYGKPSEYRVRSIDGKAKRYDGEIDIAPRDLVGRGTSRAYDAHRVLDTSFEDDLNGDIPNIHFPTPKIHSFRHYTVKEIRPLPLEITFHAPAPLAEDAPGKGIDRNRILTQRRLLSNIEYVNAIVPASRKIFENVYDRFAKELQEMATEHQSLTDWLLSQKANAEHTLSTGRTEILTLRQQEKEFTEKIGGARKRMAKFKKWNLPEKVAEVKENRKTHKKERGKIRKKLKTSIAWYNKAYSHTTNWLQHQVQDIDRHFIRRQLYARRLRNLARKLYRMVRESEHLREQYGLAEQRLVIEQQIQEHPESYDARLKWEQITALMDGTDVHTPPTSWNWVTHPESRYPGITDATKRVDLGDIRESNRDKQRAQRLRGEEDTAKYGEQFGDREGQAIVKLVVDRKNRKQRRSGSKKGRKSSKKSRRARRNKLINLARAAEKQRRTEFSNFFSGPSANTLGKVPPPPMHGTSRHYHRTAHIPFDGNYGTKGFYRTHYHHHHHLHFPTNASTATSELRPIAHVDSYGIHHSHSFHHHAYLNDAHVHDYHPGSFWHWNTEHYGSPLPHTAHSHYHYNNLEDALGHYNDPLFHAEHHMYGHGHAIDPLHSGNIHDHHIHAIGASHHHHVHPHGVHHHTVLDVHHVPRIGEPLQPVFPPTPFIQPKPEAEGEAEGEAAAE